MTRKQLAELLEGLETRKEITITNGTWSFGLMKLEMFESVQIFFGAYGGNTESFNTNHCDYEEIAEAIDEHVADFDAKETVIQEYFIK